MQLKRRCKYDSEPALCLQLCFNIHRNSYLGTARLMSLASLITPLLWAEALAHEPLCQIYPKQELRTLLVQSSPIVFVLFV